jgi:hypothetical protein
MNPSQIKSALDEQGVRADATHIDAAASTVNSMLKATADPFAGLPLEAEPAGFQVEQRRAAP